MKVYTEQYYKTIYSNHDQGCYSADDLDVTQVFTTLVI
jgi:hypothetical protein